MDMLGIKDHPSVNDRCRTCMMKIIVGITAYNIFERKVQNVSIAEILHSFTTLTFVEHDLLPKVVCQMCYEKLNSFYQFILHIENVDTKFQVELTEKEHLSLVNDMKNNFNFQEVPLSLAQENEDCLIKEENGLFGTEDDIFVESDVNTDFINPHSIKCEIVQEHVCKVCCIYFSSEGNYQRHLRKHLNVQKSSASNLPEAYKTDSIEIEVKTLEDNINSDTDEIDSYIQYKTCSSEASRIINLVCDEFNDSFQNEPTKQLMQDTEKEGVVCEICNRRFQNKHSVSAHMRIHVVKGRILSCHLCGKVFSKANNLKRHMFLMHKNCKISQMGNAKVVPNLTEEGEFVCEICERKFKSKYSMCAHMKKHVVKRRVLSCSRCGKVFTKANNLKRHQLMHERLDTKCGKVVSKVSSLKHQLLTHRDCSELSTSSQSKANDMSTPAEDGEFICEICQRRFKNKNSKSAHMRTHVVKGRILSCQICKKVFSKANNLKRHQHLLHRDCSKTTTNCKSKDTNDLATSAGEGELVCQICEMKFKSQYSVNAHMKKHVEKGRVLSCSGCGKVFTKVSHLKRHEITHIEKRQFKCILCNKSYSSKELLQHHLKQHNEAKKCPICKKTFSNMPALNTHIKIHTRNRQYLCSYCGKKFDSSSSLNQHHQRHLGIRAFACSLCPNKFVTKGELTAHTSTHTGIRPYKCKQCNAAYTKSSSLVKHMYRHMGIKPYHCDTCFKKFTTKGALTCHSRIHTGEKPYACNICGQAFTQSNDLVKHRRRHLGEKLFKCDECAESFRLKTELKHHIAQHYVAKQLTDADKIDVNTVAEKSSL